MPKGVMGALDAGCSALWTVWLTTDAGAQVSSRNSGFWLWRSFVYPKDGLQGQLLVIPFAKENYSPP